MPRDGAAAAVTLSESDGVRYLHFGTEWVQGAMCLAHPFRLELEYQQQMMAALLFAPAPAQVVQLGLGAAALTKFCHRYLKRSRTLVVDINPSVIAVARQWFALPPDDARLQVVCADAGAWVRTAARAATATRARGTAAGADMLQVDLYDARARGPVLDTPAFYRDCHAALRPGALAAFNLFGSSLAPSLAALESAFGRRWLRLPRSAAGNTVVLAWAGQAAAWQAQALRERAHRMQSRFALPAIDWLEGMRTAAGRRWIVPDTGLVQV